MKKKKKKKKNQLGADTPQLAINSISWSKANELKTKTFYHRTLIKARNHTSTHNQWRSAC